MGVPDAAELHGILGEVQGVEGVSLPEALRPEIRQLLSLHAAEGGRVAKSKANHFQF